MTPLSPTTAARLMARTVALDVELDLIDLAGDRGVVWENGDGSGLAGWGCAAVIDVQLGAGTAAAEVDDALRSIDVEGSLPPVAVGALPFALAEPGRLVVPAVVVRRGVDGSWWLTVTGSDREVASIDGVRRDLDRPTTKADVDGPGEFRVRSTMARREWRRMIAEAERRVATGRLDKVVLAREVTVEADRPLRPSEVTRRLASAYPSCMVFSVDGFVGASPELLVERQGHEVRARPLAGTVAQAGSPHQRDELMTWLMSSDKERQEHRLVVEAVGGALAPFCRDLEIPDIPSLVPVGTLAHLGTPMAGRLRQEATTVMALVDAIHPSPAVGGTPTGDALAYMAAVENLDRGRYAGPVGWVDAAGDGCFAVGIRAAQIDGRRARLMAGVGVVSGSDPDTEWAETELKLQPMLAALIRP
jgi:menaquinone-specific isochorismate synthase